MRTRSALAELDEKFNLNSCRICLTQNINMNNIFNRQLLVNIKYCTGIMIKKNNRLPSRICKNCQNSLQVAHKFKKVCLHTEKICKNLLQSNKKSEPPDDACATVVIETKDDHSIKDDNFNEEQVNKDHFNEGNFIEDHLNEDHVKVDQVKEDHFNSERFKDNVINEEDLINDVKDDYQDIAKKDVCEYEDTTEKVQCELLNSSDKKPSIIKIPQRLNKQRKSQDKKTTKKRGPYRKKGTLPLRRKKFKYFKLFCETCQIKFTSKKDSDLHRETVHKETWSFMCEVCGKLFIHRGSHYSHLRTHMPPSHECSHCDYRTSNKYDLAKHLLIHAGIKKWQCDQCPNSYHTVSNLREHQRMVHERLKRFACGACGKMFYDRTHLRRHADSHNEVKRFECDVCHTAFTRRCYWKKHLLKQHSIVIPAQRPGKKNVQLADEELCKTSELLSAQTEKTKAD